MGSAADVLGLNAPPTTNPSTPPVTGGSDLRFGVTYSQLVEPYRQQNRGYNNQGGTDLLQTTQGIQTVVNGGNGLLGAVCSLFRCSNPFSSGANAVNGVLNTVNTGIYAQRTIQQGQEQIERSNNPYGRSTGTNQNLDAGIALRAGLVDKGVGWNQSLTHWSLPFSGLSGPIDAYTTGKNPQQNIMAVQDICLARAALQTVLGNMGRDSKTYSIPSARADGSGNVQLEIQNIQTGKSSWISISDVRSSGVEVRVQNALYGQSASISTPSRVNPVTTSEVPSVVSPVVTSSLNNEIQNPTLASNQVNPITPLNNETLSNPNLGATASVPTVVPAVTTTAQDEKDTFDRIIALSNSFGEPTTVGSASEEDTVMPQMQQRSKTLKPSGKPIDLIADSSVVSPEQRTAALDREADAVSSFFSSRPNLDKPSIAPLVLT